MLTLDHLVYAVPDLRAGIAALEARLEAVLLPGGRHTAWGTRNALLGLGGRRYLEVIGPDPDTPHPSRPRPFGIDELTAPRLVAWCAAPEDLPAAVVALREVGVDLGEPIEMDRRTPGGELLVWRLAWADGSLPGGGVVPFLIDWGSTPHPSASAGSSVTLGGLTAEHPQPGSVHPALAALGSDLAVVEGDEPRLRAVLDTPSGRVELT